MSYPDIPVYYSSVIVPKFKKSLDKSSYEELLGAGLQEMIDQGVATVLAELEDPYVIVVFPKSAPSRPYEMMMTVLPKEQDTDRRSSITEFSAEDAKRIFDCANRLLLALKKQADSDEVGVTDGYIFQHFNPYDLNPKTAFNGSVTHLHLHAQLYGDSLDGYETFDISGSLSDYEGARRLSRDFGVRIFLEILKQEYPDIKSELVNSGTIGLGRMDGLDLQLSELEEIRSIIFRWDKIWREISDCFSAPADKLDMVKAFVNEYSLSRSSEQILIFLVMNFKSEDPNTWRNFYHGPNGAIGIHYDLETNNREWMIAPRVFRSWSRHLPLAMTQQGLPLEWSVKNESGDGLVNVTAQKEMFTIQKQVIDSLKKD